MKPLIRWRIRRRSIIVAALIILVILVGIHVASDISVGGFSIGGGIDEDTASAHGLPSNQRLDNTPPVAVNVLGATSVLGRDSDIYLDGTWVTN